MGLNDDAWEKLFDKYSIRERVERCGEFIISAGQIKEFREPRLMTKFDHRVNLPAIFAKYGLSILPISRGDYVISSFSAYKRFDDPCGETQRVSIPLKFQSLMPQYIVSEAIALNCAGACGILSDFLEDDGLVPTVSGRMSSGQFSFGIDSGSRGLRRVSVSSSQIEIDAAYEGSRFLSIFEAKRDLADDFLIRQLYYPFRVWSGRVSKPVKTVFLVFSNGVFRLYEYKFDNPDIYNSLRLIKQKNYAIATEIRLSDIEELITGTPEHPEPKIAFPQANSMARLINLIELLGEKPMTKQDITSEYAFNARQTNYYTDAGRYLGLIEKARANGSVVFGLSRGGHHIMSLGYRERQLAVISRILEHRAFRETLKLRLRLGAMPDKSAIVSIMKASGLYNIDSESTFERRSSTISGWINWIMDTIER